MIQRILASKNLTAYFLACATGLTLLLHVPLSRPRPCASADCPARTRDLRRNPVHLHPLSFHNPLHSVLTRAFRFVRICSSSTQKAKVIGASTVLRPESTRNSLLNSRRSPRPRKAVPNDQPYWVNVSRTWTVHRHRDLRRHRHRQDQRLHVPVRGATARLQISRSSSSDIGGLVLEVKGDFCRKVRTILESHERADDYVEVNLNADYRYNPLYNDLDAYALAYNIASLLNNLFGKGKEPFWQQAYTNLVKFIIQLHKVAYDYVTLFDVYECAINPELLEKRIHEAEQLARRPPLLCSLGFAVPRSSGTWNAFTLWPMNRPEATRPCSPLRSKKFSRQRTLTTKARWKLHRALSIP